MPFQALPIAFRKTTGSPLSKLLLIYLTNICPLAPVDHLGGQGRESAMFDFDPNEAARFCQVTPAAVYGALEELERLRLAYPDEIYVAQCSDGFKRPTDRWDFINVALPVSASPAHERKRIKCTDDQLSLLHEADGYRCVTCGKNGDDVHREGWAIDHILPRSVGGADVEENCQAICATCNGRKGAKVHWIDFLGGRR